MQFQVLPSAQDRSVNFIHRTSDGGAFEARYVRREDDYFIAYLSSHTGCNQACRFCHLTQTGQTMMGEASILNYVAQARQVLAHYATQPKARRVNFNFMARGEPFLNDEVLRDWSRVRTSLAVAAEAHGLEPRFNLSTIFPKSLERRPLKSILGQHPVGTTIYYSLYSVNAAFRKRWLPKAADPSVAMTQLREWQRETGGDVVLHWPFIEGENDSDADVDAVCEAVLNAGLDARFNLVRYNPYSPQQGRESSDEVLQRQFAKLERVCGQPGSRFVPRVGFDVKASCGMFIDTQPPRGKRSTSKQAAEAIRPVAARLREAVFDLIRETPRTCWEIEQLASLSHQTASARVNDLIKAGRIIDSKERRPTGANRPAIVWREAQEGEVAPEITPRKGLRPDSGLDKRLLALLDPSGGVVAEVGDDERVAIKARDLRTLRALLLGEPAPALQPTPPKVTLKAPEGFIIVPKEITEGMVSAWQTAFASQLRARTGSGRVSSFYKRLKTEQAEIVAYRAMLTARPPVDDPDAPKTFPMIAPSGPLITGPRIPLRHGSAATEIDVGSRRWRRADCGPDRWQGRWIAFDDYGHDGNVMGRLCRLTYRDFKGVAHETADEGSLLELHGPDGEVIEISSMSQITVLADDRYRSPFERAVDAYIAARETPLAVQLLAKVGQHPLGAIRVVEEVVPHGGHSDSSCQYVLLDRTHVLGDNAVVVQDHTYPATPEMA